MNNQSSRNFIKHFMVIGSGTAINMLIGVISTPIITRLIDPVEYGQLSIFTMYAGIAEMVLCLGLDQALVRYYYEKDNLEYRRALLFKCVKLPVIFTAIVSFLFLLILLTGILHFEFSTYYSVWLCVFTFVQIINRFSFLVIRLEYNSKLYSSLRILNKASFLIIVVTASYFIHDNYFNMLVIAAVVSLAICVAIGIIKQPDMWRFKRKDASYSTVPSKEMLMYAFPFIISMGITLIFQAMDKISLNYFCSYSEVGIYSSAMTIIAVFAIIQTTFNSLWAPMQMEHFANNPDDRSFFQKGNKMITVVMFSFGLSLILVKDLFALFLGSKYREAAYILPFLVFNPIMYTISETTVGGIIFMKKSKLQIVIAVGACITNIVGNTLLVPKIGCQGAAISTGISYIVFFTLRTFISNRYYYIDFSLKRFYFLTCVTSAYALYNTFVHFNIWCVIGYLFCMSVLVILYKETVILGINYLKKFMKKDRFFRKVDKGTT